MNEELKKAYQRIESLERMISDLDNQCFGGQVLASFPEGVHVDIAEYTRRLVKKIKER